MITFRKGGTIKRVRGGGGGVGRIKIHAKRSEKKMCSEDEGKKKNTE